MKKTALLLTLLPLPAFALTPKEDLALSNAPPAETVPALFPASKDGVLRTITIDERVGEARKGELVRVPLFFHPGECPDPNALSLTSASGGDPIAYQVDDVRRAANGEVARMHLYFSADLAPWARAKFVLKAGKNPAALNASAAKVDGTVLTLAGDDLKVTFNLAPAAPGSITTLSTATGTVSFAEGASPTATLYRQGADLKLIRESPIGIGKEGTEVRDVRWLAGPLFSKLLLRMGPIGTPDEVAYEYIVPRRGTMLTQTQRFYPLEKDTPETVGAKANILLQGKIQLGDDAAPTIVPISAGMRHRSRNVFPVANQALVSANAKLSLLVVPNTPAGWKEIEVTGGVTAFRGPPDFQTKDGSNSRSLRVFWGQTRFVVSSETDPEKIWHLSRQASQPLVAIVDEPSATTEDFTKYAAATNEKFFQIKNWTPAHEARIAMTLLRGKTEEAEKLMAAKAMPNKSMNVAGMIPSQEAVEAAWKKFQGVGGGLDPVTRSPTAAAVSRLPRRL